MSPYPDEFRFQERQSNPLVEDPIVRLHPYPVRSGAVRAPARTTQLVIGLSTALLLSIAPRSANAQTPGTSSGTAYTTTDGFGPDQVPGCSNQFLSQPSGSTSCTSFNTTPTLATASSSGTNATRTVRSQASAATPGSDQPYGDAQASQWAKLTVSGSDPAATSLVYHFVTDGMTSMSGPGGLYSDAFWQLYLASVQGVETDGSVTTTETPDFTVSESDTPNAHGNASRTQYDFTMPFDASAGEVDYSFESHSSVFLIFVTQAGQASLTATLAGIDAVNGQGQTIATADFGADGNGTLVFTGTTTTTPEPTTLALLATGLLGLAPTVRRKR